MAPSPTTNNNNNKPTLHHNNNNNNNNHPESSPPIAAATTTFYHHPPPSLEQPQPQPVVIRRRQRRNPRQTPREGKSLTIQPPYPWATTHRAIVHTLKTLTDTGITAVSGDVYCKRCDQRYQIEYDLRDKFLEIANYIVENKYKLRERAPPAWMNPTLPNCRFCGQENSVKPVIAKKKKSINWLFLLLGKMVGCCTLDQLKYFCKHTGNHRTAAKDRVVFLTYLELCKQLDPTGPFHRF
ncbi:hypothetical protein L6452_00916 [Arctium lappa]|uniref:Uncharacterized protein n=1 Tax=Arctium lappa TaxID=4217 RepID=A0ACB9FG81_ARCLA|nr:hypothetical protein L6452_00916 [Arctium lappa]